MKAGLARFASAAANHLGLVYAHWKPNEELPGGRIIVVDGPYFANRALHERVMQDNAEAGNDPIDMLVCVGPSGIGIPGLDGSRIAMLFGLWGQPVWDATNDDVRHAYPTDNNQLRIVYYESCRGLEGWTVINLGFDRFFETKLELFRRDGREKQGERFSSETAEIAAARWAMIPLTRAMDTLVIQLELGQSRLRAALEAATAECRDFVEWIHV